MATIKTKNQSAKQVAINDMLSEMKTKSSKILVKNNLRSLLKVSPQVFLTANLIGNL